MTRIRDHFTAFSICPHCNKPARVRRDGRIKFHRVRVWDEETQTGRFARCPGVGEKNDIKVAWRTSEDAERGLAKLRDSLKGKTKTLTVIDELAPAEPEPVATGDCGAVAEKTIEDVLIACESSLGGDEAVLIPPGVRLRSDGKFESIVDGRTPEECTRVFESLLTPNPFYEYEFEKIEPEAGGYAVIGDQKLPIVSVPWGLAAIDCLGTPVSVPSSAFDGYLPRDKTDGEETPDMAQVHEGTTQGSGEALGLGDEERCSDGPGDC
jgi:hypothetical protein